MLNNTPVISSDQKTYEILIEDNIPYNIKIVEEDKQQGKKLEETIPLKIQRADVVGKLIVRPGFVGEEPFTVTLDASMSKVHDTEDEIIFFTRDFGDGTPIKNNFSEAIVSHTYMYDTKNNNGFFSPIVTLKTKKGREVQVGLENPIVVKRIQQQAKIHIDSHPAQIAQVGDRVHMSLEFNGVPRRINWDFGNGKTFTCTTRQECGSTTYVYTSP